MARRWSGYCFSCGEPASSTARPLAIAVGLLGGTAALICGGSAIAMYLLTAQETTAITILAWVASGGALLAIIKSATRTLRLSLAAAA